MPTFNFVIVASGLDTEVPGFDDRLYEVGCDDATVSVQKGAIVLDFDRDAESFAAAVRSAIGNVKAAGARVERVEPDHLVNLADIAARTGISRAAASLYSSGRRGKAFPAPVARVTSDSPLWDWAEVSKWLHRNNRLPRAEVVNAEVVRSANRRLSAKPANMRTTSNS